MKRAVKWYAAGAAAAIGTLLWPGPGAAAAGGLGGYTATARAEVVHVELYEPVVPIPGSPQGDGSIAYTKVSTESGPTSRATASYLWPGDVIGDGFDQLLQQPGATYPVQVNSRNPATVAAPAKNAAQISDGNGMSTSANDTSANGTVSLVGLGGGADPLGGLGSGLGTLLGKTSAPKAPAVPVPVAATKPLAALVTANGVTSDSTVTIGKSAITSRAHAAVADLSLLGGIIKLSGVDVLSTVVSDGSRATVTQQAALGGLTIAGVAVKLGDKGLDLAGAGARLPALGDTLGALLKTLGISFAVVPVARSVDGPTGSSTAQVLQISVDTTPLKSQLNSPLSAIVALLGPKLATQLAPVLQLSPKIVLTVGDATASASASPAYDPGSGGVVPPPLGSGGSSGGDSGGGAALPPAGGTGGAGSGVLGGGTGPGSSGGGGQPALVNGQPVAARPVALQAPALPALGTVPRLLVLGALAFAGLLGWLLRNAGGAVFGGAGSCDFGLATGVPDLRKG
ncbi:hypothetical protein M6B22_21300 [Jatrophihabitans cynanchi]|uniref:Uncharacterized protein n=1 Tax=Jatrophihabitans cynanchi TaxID=2944128 RepID=A0ABY7JZ83_9ACTN|nr:choice-of-anchor P family protein [Jatrophihabitans sp. SB3-54]WAX57030.1 hypothetical protein M6B22_21300 [Jatrophihabitans sp. SB3-54]